MRIRFLPHDTAPPIRSELFSAERLEQHALSLAEAQPVRIEAGEKPSLPQRLRQNARKLTDNFLTLARAANAGKSITSAGEWFLDNFHIVEEQMRQVQKDLPPSYYRELPKLSEGPLRGYPRVYGIAWAIVAHTDSAFDIDRLERFVESYQTVAPLRIGELWAVAITLRLILVENLTRLTDNVVARVMDGEHADTLASDALAITGQNGAAGLDELLAAARFTPAFLAHFEQRLRDEGARAEPILAALEDGMATSGVNGPSEIHAEYQMQSADDVSVRNIVTAMRLVSNIDWADFFENVSLVDRILSENAVYPLMDFTTRNHYRRAIEKLARRAPLSEIQIASAALARAASESASGGDPRARDIGFYLVGRQSRAFEREVEFTPSPGQRFFRAVAATGLWGYLGAIGALTFILAALPMGFEAFYGLQPRFLSFISALALLPALDLSMALVNRLVTNRWRPQILPALSLKDGVPPQYRTVLVVPALLGDEAAIAEQIERLEVHYLANGDAGMQFILLSDWSDSDGETAPGDDVRLNAAAAGIAALNRRHAREGETLFLLLHRRRQWNAAQGKWMGWERKRGKLHEFNRLLRGASGTSFLDIDAAFARLAQNVRYVITLDADTRLPRSGARRLIGKMAHPLNAPQFDAATGRIRAGHGILQPRVTPSLPIGAESSLFQWAFSGPNGLDPYAFAVSDVYQDLFEEGSFVGKGIYDVDAFEKAMDSRIPENTILSHDLLEGVFARAALVSDIEVVEEFPSRYDVEISRQHRWVRGDWQLLPWIAGYVRGAPRGRRRPGLPALGRWKMIDNLRRSLMAPAMLAGFLAGWLLPHQAAIVWTLCLVAVMALPPLLPIADGIWPRQSGYSFRGHVRGLARDSILAATQIVFTFTFMARLAFLSLDAVLRTIFRLFISRRNLLEWITFAQSAYSRTEGWRATFLQLAASFAFAAVSLAAIAFVSPANLLLAAPFLALWAFSPLIARWASHTPLIEPHLDILAADRAALRCAARRTWSYFERFVTPADNMLPPDNFQEDPRPLVAQRTSPTNIGIYLCSVLAARDFGWIGTGETVERIEATLDSLSRLERFRGHFMNWYDTATLRSLDPRYISSVDSGNLAGNLVVIRNACAEIAINPANAAMWSGLQDGIMMLREEAERHPDPDILDAATRLSALLSAHDGDTPARLAAMQETARAIIATLGPAAAQSIRIAAAGVEASIESHLRDIDDPPAALSERLARIAEACGAMVDAMDFTFLFDETRQLLSIGYRLDEQTRDSNAYDLLASEARLASFLAIAKGDIPTLHWFRLGRTLTPVSRISALQSWSGSMFEYLMPTLIMREPPGSLLHMSNRAAVRQQMRYTARRGIPWGISESQYNARDREQNYQYSGFGVPELGIKRGLGENTVIAPYATGLAAMIAPAAACRNFEHLTRIGALGDHGWYEAIDYTRARLPEGSSEVVIRSYMAHHQGMVIMGIADVIHAGIMRERFHAEPMIKATELLLQERLPRDVAVARMPPSLNTGAVIYHDATPRAPRRCSNPATATPRTHLLSNGDYSVMVTAAGGGYSRWRGLAITRWREDITRDGWGSFVYLRDLRDGRVWSAAHQPVCRPADVYEATFSEDRASIKRSDGSLTVTTEICVSPEDNAEVRRITITNNGTRLREIEVTSYMELALARPGDDDAHPAFSKLFVQTEYMPDSGALVATRRQRSPSEQPVWAAHLSVVDGVSVGDVQFETDRARFLTRGRDARGAAAVREEWPLSNSAGPVLDPCFSLRRRVQVPRGRTVTVTFWTMAASTRKDIMDLIDRHHDASAFDRAVTLAATHAQSQLQYMGLGGDEPHLFQLLANCALYADARLRAPPEILASAAPPQAALWPFGISGDLPILLVRVADYDELDFVRQMIRARDYLRAKRLACDLVILNERAASYAQDLQKSLETLVHNNDRGPDDALGAIQLVRADLAGPDAVAALRAAARVDLAARRGGLADQFAVITAEDDDTESACPADLRPIAQDQPPPSGMPPGGDLRFFNGYGGFSEDGREYVVLMRGGRPTPAPWINVIANPDFGFQVSAEGAGFVWASNSQQNQVTPWSNDPVSNEPGDALYLRDLDSGDIWSPTASPIAHPGCAYSARHGQGYSRFDCAALGIDTTLTQFVPLRDPVRISRLVIRNLSNRSRRLSVTQYAAWALGPARGTMPPVRTHMDSSGALFARNPASADFDARVAFLDMRGAQTAHTGDRREFIGRNGSLQSPEALRGGTLSGRTGAGLDPCGVLQTEIRLAPGAQTEIAVLLGQGRDTDTARALVAQYRTHDLDAAMAEIDAFWDDTLGAVTIHTPDAAMDLLVNRWLLYQTLSCRMWGRAGFYQVSGAYGFRDQLQDSMAMCVTRPDLARAQIVRAAGRQFPEGDVQHWWLPESGKGIRTRISDDKSWLGYVTAHYVETTGDTAILDEPIAFITAPPLAEGAHDDFSQPGASSETASLYEHCARALDASLATGAHGLPLMGTGDWNDGMNRVGELGRGESVWLGWFLHATLQRFIKFAERRRDSARVAKWMVHMDALRQSIEEHGWDGAWYRRAFFDDGFALGSAANRECRIDAIAQSWSVISGVAAPERAARAMEAVDKYLVRSEDRLMALFTPPFVNSIHDPGYIKGYPAGIRENGGQYTHGVLWGIMAFAMMGDGDRAGELFSMLNPINHARSRTQAERYRVEPYVACGDVYSVTPHIGRGGWTWYSGSAAWMYRVAVEHILGLRFAGDRLTVDPVIPRHWPKFEATIRRGGAVYALTVENPRGVNRGVGAMTIDGAPADPAAGIALTADGGTHVIKVTLGKTVTERAPA